jgi:hypothetical protein
MPAVAFPYHANANRNLEKRIGMLALLFLVFDTILAKQVTERWQRHGRTPAKT